MRSITDIVGEGSRDFRRKLVEACSPWHLYIYYDGVGREHYPGNHDASSVALELFEAARKNKISFRWIPIYSPSRRLTVAFMNVGMTERIVCVIINTIEPQHILN